MGTSSVFGHSMARTESQEAEEQAGFLLWMQDLPSSGSPRLLGVRQGVQRSLPCQEPWLQQTAQQPSGQLGEPRTGGDIETRAFLLSGCGARTSRAGCLRGRQRLHIQPR